MHPFAHRKDIRELAEKNNIKIECLGSLASADKELFENDTLVKIAKTHNKTVPQVILRFENQEGFDVVPGSSSEKHILENISIFDFELSDSEMNEIGALDKGEAGRKFNIDYTISQIVEMLMKTTFYDPNIAK